jgi:hypothetical protein
MHRRRTAPGLRPVRHTTDPSSGGASLDGEPPASASPQPTRDVVGAGAPVQHTWIEHRVVLGSLDRGSSTPCFTTAAFSAARRACSSTSDVLCRDRPARARSFDRAHAGRRQASPRPYVSSKRHGSAETRTPSLDEYPLLRALPPASACASTGRNPRDHREPATVPQLCCRPASNVASPTGDGPGTSPAPYLKARSGALRGGALDQTSLVDFCNQNSPRAPPRTLRSPICSCRRSSPSSRWTDGVEAPSTTPTAGSGWHRRVRSRTALANRPRPLRVTRELPADVSRVASSQGPAGFRLPAPPVRCRSPPGRLRFRFGCAGCSRELRPNPTRPDTSRHGTVAASAGDPTPFAACPTPRREPRRRHERSHRTSPRPRA